MDSKRCKTCKQEKPIDEFCKDRSRPRGYSTECRVCANLRGRQYYKKYTKEYWRKYHMKRNYGLSWDDYIDLNNLQDDKCAICDSLCGDQLHVDHDHETGEIRGLLCFNCNAGLGAFKDNPTLISNANDYLLKQGKYAINKIPQEWLEGL